MRKDILIPVSLMQSVSFKDYSSVTKLLEPDVGKPKVDIAVQYKVNASTNTAGDTVVTTGHIEKVGE